MNCSICNGILVLLGRLGWLTYFRCRDCGMDFTIEVDFTEQDEEEYYEDMAKES